jgi:hypothetical protein
MSEGRIAVRFECPLCGSEKIDLPDASDDSTNSQFVCAVRCPMLHLLPLQGDGDPGRLRMVSKPFPGLPFSPLWPAFFGTNPSPRR